VEAGLDTVRLFTRLGGFPLKRKHWLSEKSQFWLDDGIQANVCRKGMPGVSVSGSLPRLMKGDNSRPASQLEALEGSIALVSRAADLFETPPPLENWHLTRMDVAFDFDIPFDTPSLQQIGWWALLKGTQKVRTIGQEQSTLYFQSERFNPQAPLASLAYVRQVEGREPYLRLETRFRSPALKKQADDRSLSQVVHVGQKAVAFAWQQHRERWQTFQWADQVQAGSSAMHGKRRERLEEYAAALDEMPLWQLHAAWPFDDAKTFRDDIRQGICSGIIQLPPLKDCAQAFVGVLHNRLPPAWLPY
jgi:hypothetical protein